MIINDSGISTVFDNDRMHKSSHSYNMQIGEKGGGQVSITQDFCKTWTHPYISELDDNNKLTININYKETEDTIYQECLEQAETLIQCDHPYHTSNH